MPMLSSGGTASQNGLLIGTEMYSATSSTPLDELETQVRERLLRERASTDWSQWIGNNSKSTEDWPADLGYLIGFRIAEEYVKRAPYQKQAIRDLLIMKDPQEILRKSGYAG